MRRLALVAPLAFVGVLSLALAVFLAWNARRTRARDALVRRLGERTADDARDALMREESDGVRPYSVHCLEGAVDVGRHAGVRHRADGHRPG